MSIPHKIYHILYTVSFIRLIMSQNDRCGVLDGQIPICSWSGSHNSKPETSCDGHGCTEEFCDRERSATGAKHELTSCNLKGSNQFCLVDTHESRDEAGEIFHQTPLSSGYKSHPCSQSWLGQLGLKIQYKSQFFDDIVKWQFAPSDYLSFPLDLVEENYVRRNVKNAIFSRVYPSPLQGKTAIAALSEDALSLLDLSAESLATSDKFKDFVLGKWIHPTSVPMAHRYGGYQFGWWAEQLGDGRAHLLGHYINRYGTRMELQLKGSGKTPYSRGGDGRAVVRSSVREFLAAEAMASLGFRTSRVAALVVGEEEAIRDQFYNGNIRYEKTAVVLRIASNWFRFGSLEILAKNEEIQNLKLLVTHIIREHFPHISLDDPEKYLKFYSNIVEETAEMIAQWQSIGFTHGVMNTDNMSILSVTIDYGPFGFVEEYDPNFVPNTSDDEGLYSYRNQPKTGYDNLLRLAKALQPLLDKDQHGQLYEVARKYQDIYNRAYWKILRQKFGLVAAKDSDKDLFEMFFSIMEETKADLTLSFWELGNISLDAIEKSKFPSSFWSLPKLRKHKVFLNFLQSYKERLAAESMDDAGRQTTMSAVNPRYVLRNWIAQQAIENAERWNFSELNFIYSILSKPFEISPEAERRGFAAKPPKWSKKLLVSCSS